MSSDAARQAERIVRRDTSAPGYTRRFSWSFVVTMLVFVAAGFGGFDRWFYEHVSETLETKDNPFDLDFYTLTKPLWLACRFLLAHVLGVGLSALLAAWLHRLRWRAAGALLVTVLLTALAANVIQAAIGRLRPNQAESHLMFTAPGAALLDKQNVSFPSGEAATALALATMLVRLYPRWATLFWIAGAVGAVSRLVNGAHYPSDVAAGALFGYVVARSLYPWVLATWRGMPRARRARDASSSSARDLP